MLISISPYLILFFNKSRLSRFICLLPAIILIGNKLFAQDCGCTITEVENNQVVPCHRLIGAVDTVRNISELKSAINRANTSGGNRTILISDGTYTIASTSWYPYITGSNIVFRSLSGKRDAVILSGQGMKDVAPKTENGFYIVGNNVTIADLTIKNVGNHAIAGEGDSMFVHNVKIQNTFEQMIKGTSGGDGPDHCRVQCSLFEYPAGVGPQFYIGGLDIHEGDHWIVRDNIFKNIESPSGSVAEHAIHFWDHSSDNLVERNWIINCDRGIGFGLGSSPNNGGIIRNNMIYNDGSGTFGDVGIGLETSPNTEVYNNTIYIQYKNAIEFRFDATKDVIITNNLTNQLIRSRDNGQAYTTFNYLNARGSWFQDTAIGDLRLRTNQAEVVDQGTSISNVIDDVVQTTRPQGISYDIGAHEFELPAGLDQVITGFDQIEVYPNPVHSSFQIASHLSSSCNFKMFDNFGQVVFEFNDLLPNQKLKVNTDSWPPGFYIGVAKTDSANPPKIIKLVVLQ